MLSENIRRSRKARGLTQEQLAGELNVVRQTVSKWENGLSVPDADALVRLSRILDVPIDRLLDLESGDQPDPDLTEELDRLRELLTQQEQKQALLLQASRSRGRILGASFLAMLIALLVKNEVVSILLTGACLLAATALLYRDLPLLTRITTDDLRLRTLRITTCFSVGIFTVGILVSLLIACDLVSPSEQEEEIFAVAIVSCVILFAGLVSPRLPFTRHTGLRLPWTVQDKDTWNLAHRIVGYISPPTVLLYLACARTIPDLALVTTCTMAVWIGIPGAISYVFFCRKYHPRKK